MTESQKLLADYVTHRSEEAFRELVARYVDLVYSTALRSVHGDPHLAEEVTQTVFLHLSRKASTLSNDIKLGGWLHRDTCFAASKLLRAESCRRVREKKAMEMNDLKDHSAENLAEVAPLLDAAINELGEEDRAAILLRFFERLDFRSIGETLGSTEAAAQKRVSRALAKLHLLLKHRGIQFSAAALGTALAAEAVIKSPAALTAAISTAVFAGVSGSGNALILSRIIVMTKTQASIVTALVLASAVTSFVIHRRSAIQLESLNLSLGRQAEQMARLAADNERLSGLALPSNVSGEDGRFDELQKLRDAAESLRAQAKDLPMLQDQERRIKRQVQEAQTVFQVRESIAAKRDGMQGWITAFVAYARQNEGQLPKTFEQAEPFWPKEIKKGRGAPADEYEILYDGSLNSLTNLDVIVLRERKPWPYGNKFYGTGKFGKQYGFADGELRYCSSSDKTENGSFDAFESEHIVR